MVTVGVPGTHGMVNAGMQGAGVGVPSAAAVAAITTGLVEALHMPKVGTFTNGLLSMIVPHGRLQAVTRFSGSTLKAVGVMPKLHASMAPEVTSGVDMLFTFPLFSRQIAPVFLQFEADAVDQIAQFNRSRIPLDRQ
mgnify:CR=1 FL=1